MLFKRKIRCMAAPILKFPKFRNYQAKKAVIYEGSILWNDPPHTRPIEKTKTEKLFSSRIVLIF